MSDLDKAQEHAQTLPTELLLQIIQGDIDPMALVAEQIARRGLDHGGNWVGFKAAGEIAHDFLNPEA